MASESSIIGGQIGAGPSAADLIGQFQYDIANGNLSSKDLAAAKSALASVQASNPGVTGTTVGGTGTGYPGNNLGTTGTPAATALAGAYPGLSAADQATIAGYQNMDNGMPAGSDAAKAAAGGDGSGSLLNWIQSRAGDVALIVLALLVIAVALFATVQKQNTIMTVVKKGVIG